VERSGLREKEQGVLRRNFDRHRRKRHVNHHGEITVQEDVQKGRLFHPPSPGVPRHAFPRDRRS
jgi:hypothetical protein